MTVVSSLRALDLDLSRTDAVGVKLLRAYLDFTERGPEALREEITADGEQDFDSPFEREVAEALEARGMVVHGQVGCGSFRIDLALMDPERMGHYLLGVECDGATYHSSATARDRDRLRQAVLESLGWRICRVWSTDWAHNPDGQIERVLAAFAAARESIDAPVLSETPPGAAAFEAADLPLSGSEHTPTIVRLAETPSYRSIDDVPLEAADLPLSGSEHTPTIVRLAETPSYRSIDDVPQVTIRKLLLDSLTRFGTTGEAELVKSVARQLGFQRTGARISARLAGCLDELAREGKVGRTEDGRVRINPTPSVSRG
jgi:very-short-patch-repair endonuclease